MHLHGRHGVMNIRRPLHFAPAHEPTLSARHALITRSARAAGAVAIGTLALGTLALGALAIGALAVGSLAIGRTRIRRLHIDELVVDRLRVNRTLSLPASSSDVSEAE